MGQPPSFCAPGAVCDWPSDERCCLAMSIAAMRRWNGLLLAAKRASGLPGAAPLGAEGFATMLEGPLPDVHMPPDYGAMAVG